MLVLRSTLNLDNISLVKKYTQNSKRFIILYYEMMSMLYILFFQQGLRLTTTKIWYVVFLNYKTKNAMYYIDIYICKFVPNLFSNTKLC